MGFATSSSRLVITQISTKPTPKRRDMGLAGFRDLVKFVRGRDPNVNPYVAAGDLFRLAWIVW